MGTPSEEDWPGFTALPFYSSMIPGKHQPELMKYMRSQKANMEASALDLLEKMLTMNPDKRITALQALEHEYFTSDPKPCDKSEMPKVEKECHAHLLNEQRMAQFKEKQDINQQKYHGKQGHQGNAHHHNNHHKDSNREHRDAIRDKEANKDKSLQHSNSKHFKHHSHEETKDQPNYTKHEEEKQESGLAVLFKKPNQEPPVKSFLPDFSIEQKKPEKHPENSIQKNGSKASEKSDDRTDKDSFSKRKSGQSIDSFEETQKKKH